MSAFTEYQLEDGEIEVYASTNKYMRFAIEVMDAGYTPIINAHDAITQGYNNLLPIDLQQLLYRPAEKIMRGWVTLFFSNKSRGGLIPTLAHQSGRRYYDPATGEWVHRAGDSRFFGVLEGLYASRIGMLGLMHAFLTWFPDDPELQDDCRQWANAFKQENREGNWYGHLVKTGAWTLYNFVHTGPPNGIPNDTADPEMQFRFALEGFPDSWWVIVGEYSAVAQAFVHLSQISRNPEYENFAAFINNGLWNARFNQNTYLMPDTVTLMGPLPGDQSLDTFKYMHDTDCLYWARGLFDAYQLVGGVRPDLRPSRLEILICGAIGAIFGKNVALRCQTRQRRPRLDALLAGDFPIKYLGMALGLTLDWIRYGWVPEWRHFIRKIYHDTTRGDTRLYGDGKWNTLYILIDAYKFTHDRFYLNIFDHAWARFEEFAVDPQLNGFFPDRVESGGLPVDPAPEVFQEIFLDVIVSAYLATVAAGEPRSSYLTTAQQYADRIIAAHDAGTNYYSLHNGILGRALVQLARAPGTLRRIAVRLSEEDIGRLGFENAAIGNVAVDLFGHQRVVIYMDDGEYSVVKHFADGTESPPIDLVVAGNLELEL